MKVTLLRPRGLGGRRPRRCVGSVAGVLAAALGAVLLLSLGTGALAAQSNNVVPPKGTVAGHGYAFWMQRHWQLVFSLDTSLSASSNHCKILTADGKQVAFLSGPFSTGNHGCNEPVGRPIYVNLVSAECDTFKGEHPGFGTSDTQLQLCSKSFFARAGAASATVDGHAINVKALVTATGAFPVHAVASNPIGVSPGNGRAAAYGIGLLFTGFSIGTHTIHTIAHGSSEQNITWTVNVS